MAEAQYLVMFEKSLCCSSHCSADKVAYVMRINYKTHFVFGDAEKTLLLFRAFALRCICIADK